MRLSPSRFTLLSVSAPLLAAVLPATLSAAPLTPEDLALLTEIGVTAYPDPLTADNADKVTSLNLYSDTAKLFTDAHCAAVANGLPNLSAVMLLGAKVSATCLQALSTLPGLYGVTLSGGEIDGTGLGALAALPKLQSLDLNNEVGLKAADLAALAGMKGLVFLNLGEDQLDAPVLDDQGAAVLGGLTSLTGLSLRGVDLTAAGYAEIAKLSGLTTLDLAEAPIDDAGMAALGALPALDMLTITSNTVLGQDGYSVIGGMKTLRTLNMEWTAAGGKLAAFSGLESLTTLSAPGANLTDADIAALAGLTKLYSVNVGYSEALTDAGLAAVPALQTATSVVLNKTGAGPETLALLGGSKVLSSLELSDTAVDDAAVANLVGGAPLVNLSLTNTKVTDAVVDSLKQIPTLMSVNLYGTAVSDDAKAALKAALPSVSIY